MEPFKRFTGKVMPLNRADVDTDQIVPKQFLKRIERTGFGRFLFFDWRYAPDGEPKPDFIMNQPRYEGAGVLVAGRNFGCGSSREHAPWAIQDAGFRVIIAPSFADIFYNNCFKNGLLPVALDEEIVHRIVADCEAEPGYCLSVDLERQTVATPGGETFHFEIDPYRKRCLLEGLDDIDLTLQHESKIAAYEAAHPAS
ncbi:MAG: 3-isopropylmalate dehydratase small subunit [Nitrospinota bacterium]